MALNALHESLGDELVAILWRSLSNRHFLLLKSMRVRSICLVALHAEGEILAGQAVEVVHLLWDGLHALVAAEPEVVAVLDQLLLSRSLGFFCDRFAHLVLKVLLGPLHILIQVLMRVLFHLIAPIL